jgi:Fe-S-cluster containining protein
VSVSPEELDHLFRLKLLGAELPEHTEDVEMLVYLGKSALNGNYRYDEVESHWYACRYFDKKTRLCQIYERRPKMCRNHGDVPASPCQYDGCTRRKPDGQVPGND